MLLLFELDVLALEKNYLSSVRLLILEKFLSNRTKDLYTCLNRRRTKYLIISMLNNKEFF